MYLYKWSWHRLCELCNSRLKRITSPLGFDQLLGKVNLTAGRWASVQLLRSTRLKQQTQPPYDMATQTSAAESPMLTTASRYHATVTSADFGHGRCRSQQPLVPTNPAGDCKRQHANCLINELKLPHTYPKTLRNQFNVLHMQLGSSFVETVNLGINSITINAIMNFSQWFVLIGQPCIFLIRVTIYRTTAVNFITIIILLPCQIQRPWLHKLPQATGGLYYMTAWCLWICLVTTEEVQRQEAAQLPNIVAFQLSLSIKYLIFSHFNWKIFDKSQNPFVNVSYYRKNAHEKNVFHWHVRI